MNILEGSEIYPGAASFSSDSRLSILSDTEVEKSNCLWWLRNFLHIEKFWISSFRYFYPKFYTNSPKKITVLKWLNLCFDDLRALLSFWWLNKWVYLLDSWKWFLNPVLVLPVQYAFHSKHKQHGWTFIQEKILEKSKYIMRTINYSFRTIYFIKRVLEKFKRYICIHMPCIAYA